MSNENKQDVPNASSPTNEETPLRSVSMNRNTPHRTQIELAKLEYRYASLDLAVGTIALLGGIFLFLSGIIGSTNWTAIFLSAESTITDAAPGAILFIIGLFIVIATRPKVQHA